MLNMKLTDEGQRRAVEYLNAAIGELDEMLKDGVNSENLRAYRALSGLKKVRLLLTVHFGPQLPSNTVTVRHDAPEDLPF